MNEKRWVVSQEIQMRSPSPALVALMDMRNRNVVIADRAEMEQIYKILGELLGYNQTEVEADT